MRLESWLSAGSRLLFILALLCFFLAVLEKLANLNGQTFTFIGYEPGRLLEFAAIMLLFVIAVTLRRIHRALNART